MTHTPPEDRFRQAVEMEDGQPVSAGARVAHERANVTIGRGVYLDLTTVPDSLRSSVMSEIQEVIRKAIGGAASPEPTTGQPQTN